MHTATFAPARTASLSGFAGQALGAAITTWFVVAVMGQLIFVSYILAFYARTAIQGNMPAWNKVLTSGYIPGDTTGNAVLLAHVMIAALVTLCGPLQLIPAVRARFPVFHRWSGRAYLVTVVVGSMSGLFLIWTRNAAGSQLQHIAISVNGVLILAAAWFTVRHAMQMQIASHRRWAMRLFLLVSGSWFFRVGLMFWIAANGGPAGFDPASFRGPALEAISFLQYLLPLAMLELYFHARRSSLATVKLASAASLFVLTGAMALGILVATKGMWLPLMG